MAGKAWSNPSDFVPMAEPPAEEHSLEAPLDEGVKRHLERPDQPEPIERSYVDSDDSGRRRPENETIEIGRASDDLRDIRAAERDAIERQQNAELEQAVDEMRRQVAEPHQQQQQQQQPDPQLELQPEADPARFEATIAEADREIAKFLENPAVRSRVEQEFAAVNQAANVQVEQAKAAYTQAVTQNALVGLAVLNSAFPELAGLNPEQINGALRVMRPERAEQYRQHVRQISSLVEGYQRQAGAAQQQQMEQQAHQYLQRAQELEQFKAAEDKKFDAATANENPETMKHIRENSFAMLETHYGIPQARMRALASGKERMDSTALIQSSEFQRILVDAFKFRMSQAAIAKAATRPVPQVQRPGISEPSRGDDHEVAALWSKLNSNNKGLPGIRAAAELVAARRRARG